MRTRSRAAWRTVSPAPPPSCPLLAPGAPGAPAHGAGCCGAASGAALPVTMKEGAWCAGSGMLARLPGAPQFRPSQPVVM